MKTRSRISIHALRKESDVIHVAHSRIECISIHALRKESDFNYDINMSNIKFQSTLSVRRATSNNPEGTVFTVFQSTLSVRRATQSCPLGQASDEISIHALRKESDRSLAIRDRILHVFQSTLSVRRAT